MANIYTLSKDLTALHALIDSCDDETLEEAVKETILSLHSDLETVVDDSIKLIKNIGADVDALDAEIERLSSRKVSLTNSISHIKKTIISVMEMSSVSTVKTTLFTVTSAKGAAKVIIEDKDKIPDEFLTVKTEINPDKKAILEHLKNNEIVPGARMEIGENSLRIK